MVRSPCCSNEGLNRGTWTASEDAILATYVNAHGIGGWKNLANRSGLKRCGKSCRLRWMNYLRPDIRIGNISHDEEELIIRLHKLLGNRWSLIAGRLPGRTDNEIKNYWNTNLGKKGKNRARNQDMEPKTTPAPTSPPATATQLKPIQTRAFRCTKVVSPILPPPDNSHYIHSTTLNSPLEHQTAGDLLYNSNSNSNFLSFSVDKMLQASNDDDGKMKYNYNVSMYNDSLQFEELLQEDWTTISNSLEDNASTMDFDSLAFLLNDGEGWPQEDYINS